MRKKSCLIGTVFLALLACGVNQLNFVLLVPYTDAYVSPQTTGGQTTEVFIKDWFVTANDSQQLKTKLLNRGSIVSVNVTVLPWSNSSVFFYVEEADCEYTQPTLTNFTLAIGESFAENYTYVGADLVHIVYNCLATELNSNATVRWMHEVLYNAPPPNYFIGMELWFISGLFLLVSIVWIMHRKGKNIIKKPFFFLL